MVQPINYMTTPIDPMGSALQGMQRGMAFKQMQGQQAQQQAMIAQEKQLQNDLVSLAENPTLQGYRSIITRNPQLAEKFKGLMTNMSEEEAAQSMRQSAHIFQRLQSGRKDLAVKYIDDLIAGYQNSDDPNRDKKIKDFEAQKELLTSVDGNLNMVSQGVVLALGDPDKFDQLLKTGATLGTDIRKTEQEIATAKNEKNGVLPPDKKMKLELDLRNQYLKETKEHQSVQDAYDRVKASQPTAAGDLALIFNFMKMLDPGSTVREGEFANAQNAAGVTDKVRNYYNRVMTGQRLGDTQRKEFLTQAADLSKASSKKELRVRNRISNQAEGTNLQVKNIFTPTGTTITEQFKVETPQGTFTFESQEKADAFKARANLK